MANLDCRADGVGVQEAIRHDSVPLAADRAQVFEEFFKLLIACPKIGAGADPRAANDRGSTPSGLARWTTGRGGVGSEAAKTEQQIIIDLLKTAIG